MPGKKRTYWNSDTKHCRLGRKIHLEMLALPKEFSFGPPLTKSCETRVSPAAMAAVASPRILKMAEPKWKPEPRVQEETSSYRQLLRDLPPCSNRILHLAVPNRRHLKWIKAEHAATLSDKWWDRMCLLEEMATRTIYYHPPPEAPEPATPSTASPTPSVTSTHRKRSLYPWSKKPKHEWSLKDWEQYIMWLYAIASPKKQHFPPPKPKPKRVKVAKIMEYVNSLAVPMPRKMYVLYDETKFFKVKRGALYYNISDHMRDLAKPKHPPEPHTEEVTGLPSSILHAIATPRTKELARPRIRTSVLDQDIKENPFEVNPIALKARCSRRTKELAEPKQVF